MTQFSGNERERLQLDEENYMHWNAGFRFRSLCIPPVDTVPRDGQIKDLRHCNCGRQGGELSMEPSILRRRFCILFFCVV